MVQSLAQIVRRMRNDELALLRAERALLKFYTRGRMSVAAAEGPADLKQAVALIVNGSPIDLKTIQSEILKRFPNLRSRSTSAVRAAICGLHDAGHISRRQLPLGRGCKFLYTKNEISPA